MAPALPLVAAHGGLLVTWDLAARLGATFAWLGVGFLGLLWAARRLERLESTPAGDRAPLRPGELLGVILVVSFLLRALLLPVPPTLSDDILRYLWDGGLVAEGLNPYRLAPDSPELSAYRDADWEVLPHRDVATVYPPLAVGLFSIAALLPAPLLALKLLLVAADLGACAALFAVARKVDVPASRVVWYAWNPLVTLEVAGMGHVDALGVLAVVLTVLWLVRWPPGVLGAATAASAGVLAKLVPLLALPAWGRRSGRPVLFLALALGLSAAVLAPLVWWTGGIPPGLVAYGVSWEFNGPLYEPLWRLLESLSSRERMEVLLDGLKAWTGRHQLWNRLYPYNYPQLQAKLLLGGALLVGLLPVWRRGGTVESTGRVFALLLLFSATVYPWYLLWVLPWAALCRQPAWLLLSATILVSYLPQHWEVELLPWPFLAVWAPFLLLLLWRPRWLAV